MNNVIKFPDLIAELNCIRIRLALDSLEGTREEYKAVDQLIRGLGTYFNERDGTAEIMIQLGYLKYLLEEYYDVD